MKEEHAYWKILEFQETNVIKQEAGKIKKKKAIKAEVILIVKTKVISVIKVATGTISKSCKKVPEQHTCKARN